MKGLASAAPNRRVRQLPQVSPTLFRRLSIASLVMVALIVVTGAGVRLTDSGLGCPDWPSCYQRQLTPQLSLHPVVEFSNRMVTVILIVVIALTLLAAFRRRPFRRDLAWLATGLLVGVLGQAAIGGIVVYTKLNPYVVMVHFLLTMVMVVNAVVLVHRSNRQYGEKTGRVLVPRTVQLATRGAVGLLAIVLAAGTATTGAGPHAGSSNGQQVAKRIPIALRDMAELHSSLAILLVGLCVGLAVAVHAVGAPERVCRAARVLCVVLVAQAGVGYTQYFTHLPALLVEVHVIGATTLVIGMTQFLLAITHHPREALNLGPVLSNSQPTPAREPEGALTSG